MTREQAPLRLLPPLRPEPDAPMSVRYVGYALLASAAVSFLWLLFQFV
jgi:hypothetical protein